MANRRVPRKGRRTELTPDLWDVGVNWKEMEECPPAGRFDRIYKGRVAVVPRFNAEATQSRKPEQSDQ